MDLHEAAERIADIRKNLHTRDEWDIDDFRDFYERDVVDVLLPIAERAVAEDDETHESKPSGMTLRQYAAVHAMQGMLANANETRSPENLASSSVCFADALLKVLETK